jgi:hypothetical protein
LSRSRCRQRSVRRFIGLPKRPRSFHKTRRTQERRDFAEKVCISKLPTVPHRPSGSQGQSPVSLVTMRQIGLDFGSGRIFSPRGVLADGYTEKGGSIGGGFVGLLRRSAPMPERSRGFGGVENQIHTRGNRDLWYRSPLKSMQEVRSCSTGDESFTVSDSILSPLWLFRFNTADVMTVSARNSVRILNRLDRAPGRPLAECPSGQRIVTRHTRALFDKLQRTASANQRDHVARWRC